MIRSVADHTAGSILLWTDWINEDSLLFLSLSSSWLLSSSLPSSSPTGLITHKHSFLSFFRAGRHTQTSEQPSKQIQAPSVGEEWIHTVNNWLDRCSFFKPHWHQWAFHNEKRRCGCLSWVSLNVTCCKNVNLILFPPVDWCWAGSRWDYWGAVFPSQLAPAVSPTHPPPSLPSPLLSGRQQEGQQASPSADWQTTRASRL